MAKELLTPIQLDAFLCYPDGRSARLARQGKIPHIALPNNEIRFDPDAIRAWLEQLTTNEESPDAA